MNKHGNYFSVVRISAHTIQNKRVYSIGELMNILKLKEDTALLFNHFIAINLADIPDITNKAVVAYSKQTLTRLNTLLTSDMPEQELISALTDFLKTNWDFVKFNALSYTALPEHPLTLLLCDVANVIVETNKSERAAADAVADHPLGIIQILMPTVHTESIHNEYPSLHPEQDEVTQEWQDVDIKKILKSHIISQDGLSLLPLKLLAQLDIDVSNQMINNPYYDYKKPEMLFHLNAEEQKRLFEYSVMSKNIYDAKKLYETYLSDQSNILGHLRQLCANLAFNSAYDGIGTHAQAGQGAYTAIIAFNSYYQAIAKEKDKLPPELRVEIEKLLALTSDAKENSQAVSNVETCIAHRRQQLMSAMTGHERELSEIALIGESKKEQLQQAKAEFDSSKQALDACLASGQSGSGVDKLPLQSMLLQALGIPFTLSTPQDVACLQRLSLEELENFFFSIPNLIEQFLQQVATFDNFLQFMLETSQNRLRAILSVAPDKIMHKFIPQIHLVTTLLFALDPERCEIIGTTITGLSPQAFAPSLAVLNQEQFNVVSRIMIDKIATMENFEHVLNGLKSEIYPIVYQQTQRIFAKIITSTHDVARLIRNCPIEQLPAVIVQLMPWVKSGADGVVLFKWLQREKQQVFLNLIKDNMIPFLYSAGDIVEINATLTPELRIILFDIIVLNARQLILSSKELSLILSILNPKQCLVLMDVIKEIWPGLMMTVQDWIPIVKAVNSEQLKAFLSVSEDYLLQCIHSKHDLLEILRALPLLYYRDVKLAPLFSKAVPALGGFSELVMDLTPSQCDTICITTPKYLLKLITQWKDIQYLLSYLPEEHCKSIVSAIEDKLPDYISTINELQSILPLFDFKRAVQLYKKFPPLTPPQFEFLAQLEPHALSELFNQPNVPKLFIYHLGTLENLIIFISQMSIEQLRMILPLSLQELLNLIDRDNFTDLLRNLEGERCRMLCEILLPCIDRVFFERALASLDTEQFRIVSTVLLNGKTVKEFEGLFIQAPLHQSVMLELAINFFPYLIKSKQDLYVLLRRFSREQILALERPIQAFMPSPAELKDILLLLRPEQGRAVCRILKEGLIGLIQNISDLSEHVDPHNRAGRAIFSEIYEIVPAILHSIDDVLLIKPYITLDFKGLIQERINELVSPQLSCIQQLMPEEITKLLKIPGVGKLFIDQINTIENLIVFISQTSADRIEKILLAFGKEMFGTQSLIATINDFVHMVCNLDEAHCFVVARCLEPLFHMADFLRVLPLLKEKQFKIIAAIVLKKIRFFDELMYLKSIFRNDFLNLSQQLAVLRTMKRVSPHLLTFDNLGFVFSLFLPDQIPSVMEVLRSNVCSIIKTDKSHLAVLLDNLSKEQCQIFCEAIKDSLVDELSEWTDIEQLMAGLMSTKSQVVLSVIIVPTYTTTIEYLNIVLNLLNAEQKVHIFDIFTETFQSPFECLQELKPKKLREFFRHEGTKQRFLEYIGTIDEAERFFLKFVPGQLKIFLQMNLINEALMPTIQSYLHNHVEADALPRFFSSRSLNDSAHEQSVLAPVEKSDASAASAMMP